MGGTYLEGEGMGVGSQAAVQVHFGREVKERTVAVVVIAVVFALVVDCSFAGCIVGLVLAKSTQLVALAGKVGRASAEMEPHAVEETVHMPHVARDSSHQVRVVSRRSIFIFISTFAFVYTRLVLLRWCRYVGWRLFKTSDVFIISCAAVMIVVIVIVVVIAQGIVVVMVPHLLKQWKSDNGVRSG